MDAILQHIYSTFAHHIIFSAGLLLVVGYLMGQLAEQLKLPAIIKSLKDIFGDLDEFSDLSLMVLDIFFSKGF